MLQRFADRHMPWVPAYWVYEAAVTKESLAGAAELSASEEGSGVFARFSVSKAAS